MRIADIDFPREVIDALRDNTLVVFAGAGVSKGTPACLPDFKQLAWEVSSGTGAEPQKGESEDRFLGRLQQENGTNVHALAAEALSRDGLKPTELHFSLLRLFARDQSVRLVTTNFDELFEQAAETEDLLDAKPELFRAPALPLGHNFSGIVHVHGAVSHPREMVLTDRDFGRAYLTEGWARRFLISLFSQYTVLFVGYSHNDTDMHYLARALPVAEAKRFALIGSDDNETKHWEARGIKSIVYPKPSGRDYSALDKGVKRLADILRRAVLEWRNVIREIARRPPPVNKEDADIIEESLRDEFKMRFFAEHASSPEWIDWLDERNHLDALFGEGDLSKSDKHLIQWLAERFACSSADELFLLFGRHGMRLHPDLWHRLGWQLGQFDEAKLDPGLLSRWVSVLLATLTTARSHEHCVLSELGMRCASHGDYASLLAVFDLLTESRLHIEPGFPLEDDEETPIDTKLQMVGGNHELRQIWEEGLAPNLDKLVVPLLALVVSRLEERHYALRLWEHGEWRPAIESHGQNSGSRAPNILIDIARDCLEWLAENDEDAVRQWRDRLVDSEAPLLQRIALHTVSAQSRMPPNEKIEWLLQTFDVHESKFHHEVFQLTGQVYPKADAKRRKALIAAVHAYRWNEGAFHDWSPGQLTAWQQLDWFDWLMRKAPDCPLAKQAYSDAFQRFPEFEPRELPDFLTWRSPQPEIRPTVEELLARPAAAWVDELLSFQPMDRPHARFGRERNLTVAAGRCFEWGLALADALAEAENWDASLWQALLYAWMSMDLSENNYIRVLTFLELTELHGEHAYEVANVLFSLVQNQGKSYALKLLSQVNRIAVKLWHELDRKDIDEQQDDWVRSAHDHPAGRLTEFWLYGLSVWRDAQDPMPNALNDEFGAAFSMIVKDPTMPGKLGKSALVSEFAFLLAADREWTIENLLPLFDPDNCDWGIAREGLARITIYPAVAELLAKAFLEAVGWSSSQDEYVRDQFIQRYIYMITYFVEDPIETWIPKLFKYGGEDIGEVFTTNLNENFLRDMDEATQLEWWQDWMKYYWENRLRGVPIALSPKEIAHMLHWPAQLTAVFPEAVDLAVEMGETASEHGNLLYYLDENKLVERFPNELARFLLHLDKIGVQEHWWEARDILNSLLELSVSEDVKHKIRELKARRALDE